MFEGSVLFQYKIKIHLLSFAIFRVNRRELVDVKLPYSKGMWTQSEPQVINLREGRNSIMVTFRAPNRGVSIKQFELKPVQ